MTVAEVLALAQPILGALANRPQDEDVPDEQVEALRAALAGMRAVQDEVEDLEGQKVDVSTMSLDEIALRIAARHL